MRKITYYVASSIDGIISGIDDNVRGFVSEGFGTEETKQITGTWPH